MGSRLSDGLSHSPRLRPKRFFTPSVSPVMGRISGNSYLQRDLFANVLSAEGQWQSLAPQGEFVQTAEYLLTFHGWLGLAQCARHLRHDFFIFNGPAFLLGVLVAAPTGRKGEEK